MAIDNASNENWGNCVVGVDPGSHYIGMAIVHRNKHLIDSKIVTAEGMGKKGKLISFYRYVRKIVHDYHPSSVAVERPHLLANNRVEFMHWVVGSLFLLEDIRVRGGVSPKVVQYEAVEVTKSIAGEYAGKIGLRNAVEKHLNCTFTTPIGTGTGGHDSDAAAVALYHILYNCRAA